MPCIFARFVPPTLRISSQSIHFCTSPQSDLTYCANPPIFTPSLRFVHQSYYFFPYSAFTLPTLLCSHLTYLLGHLPCYFSVHSAISAPFCCNSYNFCSSPAICVPPCQFFSRVQPVSTFHFNIKVETITAFFCVCAVASKTMSFSFIFLIHTIVTSSNLLGGGIPVGCSLPSMQPSTVQKPQ